LAFVGLGQLITGRRHLDWFNTHNLVVEEARKECRHPGLSSNRKAVRVFGTRSCESLLEASQKPGFAGYWAIVAFSV
jgi:hypothetical protein